MIEEEDKEFEMVIDVLFQQYLTTVSTSKYSIPPVPETKRNLIMDYPDHECKLFYTFNSRDDLGILFKLLKFPDVVKFDNRSTMIGEEVFLRGLYELTSADNQEKICVNVFGRECSRQSRAYTYFMTHLYDNFKHLLCNNIEWFYKNHLFEESAVAIGKKMECDECTNLVFAFIDCNCLQTSVVGGGPNEGKITGVV
jgi:hypothetical protein